MDTSMTPWILLVSIATVGAFSYLIVWMLRRQRTVGAAIAVLGIFMYSSVGSFIFLSNKRTNPDAPYFSHERYLGLLSLDSGYLRANIYFLVFAVTIGVGVSFLGRYYRPAPRFTRFVPNDVVNYWAVLTVTLIITLASTLTILETADLTKSVYLSDYDFGRLHDYAVTACTGASATALVALRPIHFPKKVIALTGFAGVFILNAYILWILGRRNLLMCALVGMVIGALILTGDQDSRRKRVITGISVVAVVAVSIFLVLTVYSATRGVPPGVSMSDQIKALVSPWANPEGLSITNPLTLERLLLIVEGEILAPHYSLYDVISEGNVPFFYGIPAYSSYSAFVGNTLDQGFTAHPITAWMMFVGPAAALVAGVFLASILSLVVFVTRRISNDNLGPFQLAGIIMLPASTAIFLSREGPLAVWGLLLQGILLPGLLLSVPTVLASSLRSKLYASRK